MTPVRMAAEHEIEACMRCMPISLRCVRQEDRDCITGNIVCRAVVILKTIEMGVVNASKIERLSLPLNLDVFVEKQPIPHCLHGRDHTDRVMVAEHGVYALPLR